MKSRFLLLFFLLSVSLSHAQIAASSLDSTTLIDIYEALNIQARNNLNWADDNFSNPVYTWDGVLLKDDSPGNRRPADGGVVIGLNLSNIGITGSLPGQVADLQDLLNLNISNNSITELPDNLPDQLEILSCHGNEISNLPPLPNTIFILIARANQITSLPNLPPNLSLLDVGENKLLELPLLPSSLFQLYVDNNRLSNFPSLQGFLNIDTINCSNNELTFKDIDGIFQDIFGSDGVPNVDYTAQRGLGDDVYVLVENSDALFELYPENDPLPLTNFIWTRLGITEGNEAELDLPNLVLQSDGTYVLEVTNIEYPDLTLTGSIRLYVVPEDLGLSDEDPNITVQYPPNMPTEFYENTRDSLESAGFELRRSCWCDELGRPRLELYNGPGKTLLDANGVGTRSKSKVDADTLDIEINFPLVLDPIITDTVSVDCETTVINNLGADLRSLVALIDSGSDLLHIDLNTFIWMNNNLDDLCFPNAISGWDFPNSNPDIVDLDNHGTHSMGIIRYRFPNDINLSVMNLKVFERDTGLLFDMVCAIHYAVDQEVDVINLSLGYYSPIVSPSLYTALKRARDADIPIIISAGNDGIDVSNIEAGLQRFPGNLKVDLGYAEYPPLDNLVVVGSLNSTEDSIAYFSSYGPYVDILAPGEGIRSTISGDEYGILSGTSMATAAVTRIVAIARAKAPEKTYSEIIACIQESVDTDVIGGELVAWQGKIDEQAVYTCLGIEVNEVETGEGRPEPISIWPNPFLEEVFIQLEDGTTIFEDVTFTVTTMHGNVVYTETCSANLIRWDGFDNQGNKVPRGFYFVIVQVGNTQPHIVPVIRL